MSSEFGAQCLVNCYMSCRRNWGSVRESHLSDNSNFEFSAQYPCKFYALDWHWDSGRQGKMMQIATDFKILIKIKVLLKQWYTFNHKFPFLDSMTKMYSWVGRTQVPFWLMLTFLSNVNNAVFFSEVLLLNGIHGHFIYYCPSY